MLMKVLRPLAVPLISANQFAFVPDHFTGTSISVTILKCYVLNQLCSLGGSVRCIAIDFSKAFDKVSHKHLLEIAQNDFHLPLGFIIWLKSYLIDRKQRILHNDDKFTDWISCTSWVPQGSVLGPILFCMLMNSYEPLYPSTKAVLYADDLTLLHHTGLNIDRSQMEIDHLVQWYSNNSMTINVGKCASMTFTFVDKVLMMSLFTNQKCQRLMSSNFLESLSENSSIRRVTEIMFLQKLLLQWPWLEN